MRPFIIAWANRSKCLCSRSGPGWGWDYAAFDHGWMSGVLFFQELFRFNNTAAATRRQRALLLLDNTSCHGAVDIVPKLSKVNIYFLPKKTTAILQPIDSVIIVSGWKRCKREEAEKAVPLVDRAVLGNVLNASLHQSITWIH